MMHNKLNSRNMKQKYSILSLCAFMCMSAFCHLAALPEHLAAQIPALQENVEEVRALIDKSDPSALSFYKTRSPLRVQNVWAQACDFLKQDTCGLTVHDQGFALKIASAKGEKLCPFETRWIPRVERSNIKIDWNALYDIIRRDDWREAEGMKAIETHVLDILKKVLPYARDHYYKEIEGLVEAAKKDAATIGKLSDEDWQSIVTKAESDPQTSEAMMGALQNFRSAQVPGQVSSRSWKWLSQIPQVSDAAYKLGNGLSVVNQNRGHYYTGIDIADTEETLSALKTLLKAMKNVDIKNLKLLSERSRENVIAQLKKVFVGIEVDCSNVAQPVNTANIKNLIRSLKQLKMTCKDSK